jgi:uncharacterized protein (DUF1800 family)
MALDQKVEAAICLHRFGLGPRNGSIAAIASDPRGALLAELDSPGAVQIRDAALLPSAEALRAAFKFRQEQRALRLAERRPPTPTAGNSAVPGAAPARPADQPPRATPPNATPGVPQRLYLQEAKACMDAALKANIGFAERLAWFWSNHFCVSADKGNVRPICGAYEREAIRSHVLGRFGDMLLAVESHPAMLIYLDNARSIGPGSFAGLRQKRGLNENLAREILELHTLGVRTVYTQQDVTSFANVITGWTVVPLRQDPAHGGEFLFNPRTHEPGAHGSWARAIPIRASSRGARYSPCSPVIPPPPDISRPSWLATSSPTIRRLPLWSGFRGVFSTRKAISRRWPRLW